MFKPNLNCAIEVANGETDVYGQPLPSRMVRERCAIVKLDLRNVKSAVRADTSASRGAARELQADAKFLLTTKTAANIDDIIHVSGWSLKIISKFPRHDVQGKLDHYEVDAMIWN